MRRSRLRTPPRIPISWTSPPHAGTALVRYLRQHVSGEVRFDDTSRRLYATDASHYQIQPLGVVLPKTADDLAVTVQIAADLNVPITARGGGTSLSGQSIGPGIVIDCSKYLNAVGEVDVTGRRVRVQPGVVLDHLNRELAPPRADVRPGRGDRQPRHARRHDRQQLRRRAVGRLQADGRSRPRALGGAFRRHARRVRPAVRDRVRAEAGAAHPRGRRLPRRRRGRARPRRRDRSPASRRSCGR